MKRFTPVTADEAASQLRPIDRLGIPLGPGQPVELLKALGRRDDWQRLEVFAALLIELFPLFARSGVSLRSGFFGPAERALRAAGHDVSFVPADFRRFETLAREFAPRVVATAAAPPDDRGRVSLSLHAGATIAEIEAAARDPERLLVVETSPAFPRTFGLDPDHPHALALEDVDLWIESEARPLELPDDSPGPVEKALAEHACAFIPDGATLQTGIGGVPDAIAGLLAESQGSDYGIHTEMFTTGLMRLHESGSVGNHKGVFDGFSIATFALGSRELYDWLEGRESVRFLPVDIVNDPAVIGRNRQMISINGALSIDLFGQVVADSLGGVQHSGIGGHEDFLAGVARSQGGRSLVCLPSTVTIDEAPQSRIVAELAAGAVVTSPRHQIDVVVTEHGAAELAGRTVEERARALAAIADPRFRGELEEAAERLGRCGVRSSGSR